MRPVLCLFAFCFSAWFFSSFHATGFSFILEVYSFRSKRDANPELAGRGDDGSFSAAQDASSLILKDCVWTETSYRMRWEACNLVSV